MTAGDILTEFSSSTKFDAIFTPFYLLSFSNIKCLIYFNRYFHQLFTITVVFLFDTMASKPKTKNMWQNLLKVKLLLNCLLSNNIVTIT